LRSYAANSRINEIVAARGPVRRAETRLREKWTATRFPRQGKRLPGFFARSRNGYAAAPAQRRHYDKECAWLREYFEGKGK
jgi:hypothetical protein